MCWQRLVKQCLMGTTMHQSFQIPSQVTLWFMWERKNLFSFTISARTWFFLCKVFVCLFIYLYLALNWYIVIVCTYIYIYIYIYIFKIWSYFFKTSVLAKGCILEEAAVNRSHDKKMNFETKLLSWFSNYLSSHYCKYV
jgi:hypothetical protein